ncbi:hypothetical protein V6N13_020057 [Hibiscus sabdariffa]|uniref:Fungal lipase-type domain-containing protein n=1 Tax=Hibiscus sabdariffa TaxID=183260 RepID=A0ABR2ESB7_9ROSI
MGKKKSERGDDSSPGDRLFSGWKAGLCYHHGKGKESNGSGIEELEHLSSIDWNRDEHRMSVSAILVKGVYMLEDDRQARRQDSQCQAPPWWNLFNFELDKQLVDDDDSIFGAVFKYNPSTYHSSIDRSPLYVIAFRGTLFKLKSYRRDIKLDIKIIRNGLHETSRFKTAMKAVQDVVSLAGVSNVWLTGHSLGASIAILAGKEMAKIGNFMDSFTFNPPFVSPPIEGIKSKKVKQGLRYIGTSIKVGVSIAAAAAAAAANDGHNNSFAAMSGWIPRLFVNRSDPICAEYIGYFEHRRKLEDKGAGCVARETSQYSLTMKAVGKKDIERREPLHLLPSASLTVNSDPCPDCNSAHSLRKLKCLAAHHALAQWWRPDLNLSSDVYKYQ